MCLSGFVDVIVFVILCGVNVFVMLCECLCACQHVWM